MWVESLENDQCKEKHGFGRFKLSTVMARNNWTNHIYRLYNPIYNQL